MKLTLKKLKTIDVTAKEWFDRINGNSYFSAVVCLNYGMPTQEAITLPFQYGYGSHYEDMALAAIGKRFAIETDKRALRSWCSDRKITLRLNMQDNCLKRDVTRWGCSA